MTNRTIIVGDIHGCIDELVELIDIIQLDRTDHLILLGDYIDKGPASFDVLKYLLYELPYKVKTLTCLLGNHEEKFFRWVSNKKVQERDGSCFKELKETLADTEISLLKSKLVLVQPINNYQYICVHGGIPALPYSPEVINEYQHTNFNKLIRMNGTSRDLAKYLLFTRFVNPKGYPVALGKEQSEDQYWADVYDGRFGIAIYGHQPIPDVYNSENAIGIDTGCVYGGKLTAVIRQNNGIKEIVQVKAKKEYRQPSHPITYEHLTSSI